MATTYGMRGRSNYTELMVEEADVLERAAPGQHVRLTRAGAELLAKGQLRTLQMEAAFMGMPIGAEQRELMFAARMYRCAHCGTRYESLPSLQGAVKCRQCGSPEIGEET